MCTRVLVDVTAFLSCVSLPVSHLPFPPSQPAALPLPPAPAPRLEARAFARTPADAGRRESGAVARLRRAAVVPLLPNKCRCSPPPDLRSDTKNTFPDFHDSSPSCHVNTPFCTAFARSPPRSTLSTADPPRTSEPRCVSSHSVAPRRCSSAPRAFWPGSNVTGEGPVNLCRTVTVNVNLHSLERADSDAGQLGRARTPRCARKRPRIGIRAAASAWRRRGVQLPLRQLTIWGDALRIGRGGCPLYLRPRPRPRPLLVTLLQ